MYIKAEDIQPGQAREQLVQKLNDQIKANKTLHKQAFERMRTSVSIIMKRMKDMRANQ